MWCSGDGPDRTYAERGRHVVPDRLLIEYGGVADLVWRFRPGLQNSIHSSHFSDFPERGQGKSAERGGYVTSL